MAIDLDALVAMLCPVGVSGPDSELQSLAHGLRQACLGAVLDPSVSEQEIALVISVFVDGSRERLVRTSAERWKARGDELPAGLGGVPAGEGGTAATSMQAGRSPTIYHA